MLEGSLSGATDVPGSSTTMSISRRETSPTLAAPVRGRSEDAREAVGHGIRAKRSKSGAVSFDLMDMEAADAPLQ